MSPRQRQFNLSGDSQIKPVSGSKETTALQRHRHSCKPSGGFCQRSSPGPAGTVSCTNSKDQPTQQQSGNDHSRVIMVRPTFYTFACVEKLTKKLNTTLCSKSSSALKALVEANMVPLFTSVHKKFRVWHKYSSSQSIIGFVPIVRYVVR